MEVLSIPRAMGAVKYCCQQISKDGQTRTNADNRLASVFVRVPDILCSATIYAPLVATGAGCCCGSVTGISAKRGTPVNVSFSAKWHATQCSLPTSRSGGRSVLQIY